MLPLSYFPYALVSSNVLSEPLNLILLIFLLGVLLSIPRARGGETIRALSLVVRLFPLPWQGVGLVERASMMEE